MKLHGSTRCNFDFDWVILVLCGPTRCDFDFDWIIVKILEWQAHDLLLENWCTPIDNSLMGDSHDHMIVGLTTTYAIGAYDH